MVAIASHVVGGTARHYVFVLASDRGLLHRTTEGRRQVERSRLYENGS